MKAARREEFATQLASMLAIYHGEELFGDEELRDAVIIKSVALCTLAFDIPAVKDEGIDYEEALEQLEGAVSILHKRALA